MQKQVMAVATILTLWVPMASGAQDPGGLAPADPRSVGLSAQGLALATEALQARIDAGDLAGVVAAVARDGKLVYREALGHRDVEDDSPMAFDALFRTYSMTRPITALAVLMLHEDGVLDIRDPVQEYLPEFAKQEVLSDPQSSHPSDTRPRVGDITLAQLLTHTSGIGSRNSQRYRAHNVHSWDQTLEEVVNNVARLPLFEDPGTRFRYGMHSEILGRVIETVSEMELEAFFEERIFRPLGMSDTMFFVDGAHRHRLVTVYRADDDGNLQPHDMEDVPVTEPRTLASSGVGLVSTAMDFLRFSQLLLDDGMVNGEPFISPEAIRMMAENAVPEELLPLGDRGYWAGSGWSLGGFAVVLDPSAYDHTVNPGEFWWDGSAGTRFWIDPRERMITIVLAQISPASGNGFREAFKSGVYQAIEERR